MNSLKEWLKPGLGLKRWILCIILGVGLLVYSLSTIIVENTPEISTVVWMVIFFVVGFVAIVYSIINIQKRTLEIFVESSSNHKNIDKGKVDIKSLIYNTNIFDDGPKVVVISGGSGLNTIISGLKKYTNNITAIVTLSDYHEDLSRKVLNTLPYSDIKESVIALSDDKDSMKKLMDLNFTSKKLEGLNFGDIFLLAMQESYGNIPLSIKKVGSVLNIVGDVIPCSSDEIKVCAELTDGSTVETKEQIPLKVMEKLEAIKRIYLNPTNARVTPSALKAIEEADLIVIGPGNLYTNVIPNLLVKHISQTIKESEAIKVYVSNIMTDKGQTDGYTLSEHIKAIFDHSAGKIFDYVIADTGEIVPEYLRAYHKDGEDLVEIDEDEVKKLGIKLIQKDVSTIYGNGRIRHDGDAIATHLMEILMSDLRYQDTSLRKDNIKKTLIDTVLKGQRKKEKQKQKAINKARKKGLSESEITKKLKEKDTKKGKSVYSKKYKDRVENIKDDQKRRELEEFLNEEQPALNKEELGKEEKEILIKERAKNILEKSKENLLENNNENTNKIDKKEVEKELNRVKSRINEIQLDEEIKKYEETKEELSKKEPEKKEEELNIENMSNAERLRRQLAELEKYRLKKKHEEE